MTLPASIQKIRKCLRHFNKKSPGCFAVYLEVSAPVSLGNSRKTELEEKVDASLLAILAIERHPKTLLLLQACS